MTHNQIRRYPVGTTLALIIVGPFLLAAALIYFLIYVAGYALTAAYLLALAAKAKR